MHVCVVPQRELKKKCFPETGISELKQKQKQTYMDTKTKTSSREQKKHFI